MGPLELLLHIANFVAPAFAVGAVLALVGRFIGNKRHSALAVVAQIVINFIVGAVVLGLGLWWFGRDAKMATYAALVVVMATGQWLGSRAWR